MTSLPRRVCCIAMLSGLIAFTASQAGAGNVAPNMAARSSNQSHNQSIDAVSVRQTNAGYGSGGHAAPPAYGGEYGRKSRPHHFDPNTQFDGIGSASAAGTVSKRPK
jgi:hypothetical protein